MRAVAASRLGAEVVFLGAVGDDESGHTLLSILAKEGIDASHVVRKPSVNTGTAFIPVDSHGENIIAVSPGANGQLIPHDLQDHVALLSGTEAVLLQHEIPLSTIEWVVDVARSVGCRVILNPAPMLQSGLCASVLSRVDVLIPNEGELRSLVPTALTVEDAAAEVLAMGTRLLVVSKGGRGVTLYEEETSLSIHAIPVAVADTVGAGDCFCGAFSVALSEGATNSEALRFAVVAAGLSTRTTGAQAGMPFRADVVSAMQECHALPEKCGGNQD